METKTWYEVYCYDGSRKGTKTLESFDTLGDAQRYVADRPSQDLYIDKWETTPEGVIISFSNSI